MNKVVFIIFMFIAVFLAGYNLYLIDYSDLFADKNFVASISALAALSAVVLLLLLNTSKKIANKVNR